MLQNLLVNPPAMYWPSTLVTVQLFTTLYSTTSSRLSHAARQMTSKRLHVFLVVFLITFIYQFFPFLLFPTLTSVSVLCLIDNRSYWLRTFGSAYSGLGMLDFSFDWSSIGASGPLYTPYWAQGNYFGGLVGMIWVVSVDRDFGSGSKYCGADSPGGTTHAVLQLLVRPPPECTSSRLVVA